MSEAVDICLCTFRRQSVHETLESLAALTRPADTQVRVIVADNDEHDEARQAIVSTGDRLGLDLVYVHAPARNISVARNATLDAATAPWVAVLDDDELAAPDWLSELIAAARRTGADVVVGPVVALYADDVPRWMKEGDFHSAAPVTIGSEIRTGYTSNVLFRREAPSIAGLRFRLDLGRTGGEDTEFFHRAFKAGAKIVSAPQAIVSERVEGSRASLAWLLKRKFRSGQSHGLLLLSDRPRRAAIPRQVAIAAAKCTVSLGGAILTAPMPRRRTFWVLRTALHAGVVSRLLGMRKLVQYGGNASVSG